MILWLIRFLRGWVRFKITGGFPERFVNLSVKRGVGIFDIEPHSSYIEGSMLLSEYRFIRPIARHSGVRLRIKERHGLPFFINRHKNRWGLIIGALIFLIACVSIHNFVWIIEVNGAETISKPALIAALEEKGIKEGRYKEGIDLHRIERELQLQFKEIGWMSINILGSKVEVEVKEKTKTPDLEYSPQFCNIKASKDGVIVSSNVRRGTAEVIVGSGVTEGQLLVSGMYKNALGEIHFVDADADIIAETKYVFRAECDLCQTVLVPQKAESRSLIEILWIKFPVTFKSEEALFTSYTENRKLFVNDRLFPVSLKIQHMQSFERQEVMLSKREAEEILRTEVNLYKLFNLKNAEIIEETTDISKNEDKLIMTATFKCRENIAVKEKLVVNQ